MSELRKIIHIDMDAYFAAVEQRDNPAYQGNPIVVGGSPDKRGAVAAASYEARKFGIHSAMPARTALHRCPNVIFVSPRFEVYRQVSQQIRAIFHRYTDLVEPLALDEAYLDVTENKKGIPSATWIANEIRQQIYEETSLTASAGISINKFLAKIASGMNKPNGSFLIAPDAALAFVEQLAIEKFHGIGQVTAAKMHQLGIKTGADLKQWSEADLVRQFGKVGRFYFKIARAEDHRPVQPNRVLKSVGAETTFEQDLDEISAMMRALELIAQTVERRLSSKRTSGRTLTLKIKFANYEQITRSRTEIVPIAEIEKILEIAQALLPIAQLSDRKVRLLGISISNLSEPKASRLFQQLALPFIVG
jgi:DNA polymerase-4